MKRWMVILICLFQMQAALCQLCTGSLGDPLVNITFGNISTPLKAGVTNLIYSYNCPNDGQYTITHASSGCFNNTWNDITSDHTGDKNGQLMLINASLQPNDFYVDTVSGLCGNTTFEFAAWVTNVLRPYVCGGGVQPNLTFQIETTDGKVLIKYNSGNIAATGSIQWRQFGTFFTTPAGITTVVLRITNNANGGCGNDLAIDDITFRPCGPTIATIETKRQSTDVSVCQNDTVPLMLTAVSSAGFANAIVQWQVSTDSGLIWKDISGARTASYTHTLRSPGTFEYRTVVADAANFSNAQCRVASNVTTLAIHPLPARPSPLSIKGCTGSDLLLSGADTTTGNTYQWNGPNNFISSVREPVISNAAVTDSGYYRVRVSTVFGCERTDTFHVSMNPGVKAVVSGDASICEGASAILSASGGIIYKWSPSNGLSNTNSSSTIASPPDTTVYQVMVTNQYGCNDSAKVNVIVFVNPVINAGPDKILFEGESVTLDGSIAGKSKGFFWSPLTAVTNASTLSPTVSPADPITYTLNVIPVAACPAVTDAVTIYVYKKLQVPNAFSPNGDGINDTWRIKGLDTYPDGIVSIYDRKGILLYTAHATNFYWNGTYNGTPLLPDTYYYVIDTHLKGMKPISGWVVILK